MTNEEMNLRTKLALADALKEKMKVKSYSKITISELVKDCNINRKTFYYHFNTINDLLKWILEREALHVVTGSDFHSDFRKIMEFTLDYLEANSLFLNCAYDSLGCEEMRSLLIQDFLDVIQGAIGILEREMNLHIQESFRKFICTVYTEAIVGVIIDWLKGRSSVDRHELIEYMNLFTKDILQQFLKMGAVLDEY